MDQQQLRGQGTEIFEARRRRHWTNEQLAAAAKVAPNTITRIERGRPTRVSNVTKVREALGIKPWSETTAYTRDVEILRDLVSAWLLAAPADERKSRESKLLNFVTSQT